MMIDNNIPTEMTTTHYKHDKYTGETKITNRVTKVIKEDRIDLKGCGCRYRNDKCEYLCSHHSQEFILRLYNGQMAIKQMKEEKNGYNGV
jgi:hypothetical protein